MRSFAGYPYSVLETPPLLLAHVHLGGMWLRSAHATLYIWNVLLLEPEQTIDVRELWLKCYSHSLVVKHYKA